MLMIPDLENVRPQVRGPAADAVVRPFQDHDVVGHQLVAAKHEIECRLALPDGALADNERADAEDLDEDAVHADPRRQPFDERARDLGEFAAPEHRHLRSIGPGEQLPAGRSAAHNDASRFLFHQDEGKLAPLRRGERTEVVNLAGRQVDDARRNVPPGRRRRKVGLRELGRLHLPAQARAACENARFSCKLFDGQLHF
jgi:hypothetical protein